MRQKIAIFLMMILLVEQNPAIAQEARLSDMIVSNSRDKLLLYLKVDGAFTDKMRRAVLSGVPTTFSFLILVERTRGMWMNEGILDLKLSHTVKYNTLKKEFTVKRSWEEDKPVVTKSFAEAQNLMCEVDNIHLISLNELQKGHQYRIRAKAELSEITLPFYLHYLLFFIALWKFETEWYTIDFTY